MEYDYTLEEWIDTSQLGDVFKECINAIEHDKSLDGIISQKKNERFENILDEEINKQFHNSLRPVVEIVLNSIDAKLSGQKDYTVEIESNSRQIKIKDNGESMGIEDILTKLIIPYVTDKFDNNDKDYIGKFGIGFLSVLKYCLQNPENPKQSRNSVILKTNKKGKSYECLFYAKEDNPSSLRLKLKKAVPERYDGTVVLINKSFDLKSLKEYLANQVKSIPSFQAIIKWNGEIVNKDSGEWYTSTVKLKNIQDQEISQDVAVQLQYNSNIILTSKGVARDPFNSLSNIGLMVLFPPLVEVPMGRNDFKKDMNYKKAAQAVFNALEKIISEDKILPDDFIELIPSLTAALELQHINNIPNISKLTDIILPNKKYVLMSDEIKLLQSFYGNEVIKKAFSASPQSYIFWQSKFKEYNNFVDDCLNVIESSDFNVFADKVSNNMLYPNLRLLFNKIGRNSDFSIYPSINKIKLVSFKPAYDPFMYDQKYKEFYVNVSHRHIAGEYNSLKVNANISNYLSMPQIKIRMMAKHDPNYIQRNLLLLKEEM